MKEKVLITGANGLIAKKLGLLLEKNNYQVCYLSTKKSNKKNIFYWNLSNDVIEMEALSKTDHIIHLAGYSISNIWTKKNKQKMFDSRVKSSQLIFEKCKEIKHTPKTYISASAMGYYGLETDGLKKENDIPQQENWMSLLCEEWEKKADQFKELGSRILKLRLSLILDKNGGILEKILLGFYFRIGLVFGKGTQPFPWIHSSDVAKFILHCIQNKEMNGPINLSTQKQITLNEFMLSMQRNIQKKTILIYIPKWIIQIFIGEQSSMLFSNVKLSVSKMKEYGFTWDYENIDQAIQKEIL